MDLSTIQMVASRVRLMSGVPVCLVDEGANLLFGIPNDKGLVWPTSLVQQEFEIQRSRFGTTPRLVCDGPDILRGFLMVNDQLMLMVGPVTPVKPDFELLMQTYSDQHDHEQISRFYRLLCDQPTFDATVVSAVLATFSAEVHNQMIPVSEVLRQDWPRPKTIATSHEPVPKPSARELEGVSTFMYELLDAIRAGDEQGLSRAWEHPALFTHETYFEEPITHIRLVFAAISTIICVAAVESGVEAHFAYQVLNDYYAQMLLLDRTTDFIPLIMDLSFHYCGLVHSRHEFADGSYIISKCTDYVYRHLGERVSVSDLARHCNVSERTISRHFHQGPHKSVPEYVLDIKMRRAQFLLSSTERPISEISALLGFSDQSYFSRLFSREVGCPPHAYRNRMRKA